MKAARSIDFTFKNHLSNLYYLDEQIDRGDLINLLDRFSSSYPSISCMPLLFLIDYARGKYVVMGDDSRLITGQDPRAFLDGGIPVLLDIFQQDDFKVYNEKIFKANSDFLKSKPASEHHQFLFSYNFRVKHANGSLVSVLQKGSYITSPETGLPLYSFGTVTDITDHKKDTVIKHIIEKKSAAKGNFRDIVQENFFFPHEEDRLLSRHELAILELMAEGFSGKQISLKMKITENTTANHRKNMLRKMNVKNVAEMVAFACRTGLI